MHGFHLPSYRNLPSVLSSTIHLLVVGFCCTLLLASPASAQTYTDSIREFRKKQVEGLLAEARSPIKASQVKDLQFYEPDPNYRVPAHFTPTPSTKPFMVPTHSGKLKPFREYGTLSFYLSGKNFVLHVYQSADLLHNASQTAYLFLPFNDDTNNETTYGGGRYIDLTTDDVAQPNMVLDFNKSYNPYCAYAEGYSCPIPPQENKLHVAIKAGEQVMK